MPERISLPALRGVFGSWVYYSCLMPVQEVASRVRYAEEVHKDKALSQLIQRALEGPRATRIAEYLRTNPDRFFNSLVLATYGGSPEWVEIGNFKATRHSDVVDFVPQGALDALGFLSLRGPEKIFALDGQHRLAGIKKAVETQSDFDDDYVSVVLVAHKNTKPGLERTRRLFTTLNKTAVPVKKSDIIALDEDDVMAIVARRLVENDLRFKHPKIAVISSINIPASNKTSITTISNLYDTLKLIFQHRTGKRSDQALRFNRPSDKRLEEYHGYATAFFDAVAETFEPVHDLMHADDPEAVAIQHRTAAGGHVLFRPIGWDIFTRTAIALAAQEDLSLPDAVRAMGAMETSLGNAPYKGVLWDPSRQVMIASGKRLARRLTGYSLGLAENEADLRADYAAALGVDENKVKLPRKVR